MNFSRRTLITAAGVAGADSIFGQTPLSQAGGPGALRLAVAGLVHGHAGGFLRQVRARTDVDLVGVSEADTAVLAKYGERFQIPEARRFRSLEEMLAKTQPEAIAAFGSTFDHAAVVETAARAKLPVMMEKPLAVSLAHANRIRRAASSAGIPVIVNYETTWYRSHGLLYDLLHNRKAAGEIRKMVAMDGHQGPREIGTPPEFFNWLTDPVKNGAGALFDFGCYGANLMTWLMDNQRPEAVTARTLRIKPAIYPKVDDDATILLDYPRAEGIIQASWNWPFNRKDFEAYGVSGYANAYGGSVLRVRLEGEKTERNPELPELPPNERDSISYLAAVARRALTPAGLSSLENNLIVTEILVAARESARTGKTVPLR
ncbi:MAG: Gfo/Idh/MocA family oxidoreductase [Bryobacterales bacterium]|nr:Gfo/Idh/MocA family oxidoreductase [Bryobacterales bacterium]